MKNQNQPAWKNMEENFAMLRLPTFSEYIAKGAMGLITNRVPDPA